VAGVGIVGLTMEGGYSWFTNQCSLAVDNIVAFEVTVPNGPAVVASAEDNSDLWFALKVYLSCSDVQPCPNIVIG
jgi:hypothetical protein